MECNTAAVFHVMRAVEHGLRALAVAVDVNPGKLPLEYQEWNELIDQVKKKSSAVDQWGKSAELTNARQWFHRVIGDLYSFKDDVRNVTMHTRKSYNSNEAMGVHDRAREWFQVLASKVSDGMRGTLIEKSRFTP